MATCTSDGGGHTAIHRRHVCPLHTPLHAAMHKGSQDPSPASPIDNEISPPCGSSCPSWIDSPPSHNGPPQAVCAQGRLCRRTMKDILVQSGVAVPSRRIAGASARRNLNTDKKTLGRDRNRAASHVHDPDQGIGQPTGMPPAGSHSEATSKDLSGRIPHRRRATGEKGALRRAESAGGRLSCLLVVARFGAGRWRTEDLWHS